MIAYPMLKIEVGILEDDPVEMAEGAALIAVDALGGLAANMLVKAARFGFTSRANLLRHFAEHGGEFGFKVADQYGMAARQFTKSAGRQGVETVAAQNGERIMYSRATKEFARINREGRTISYHKASVRYWEGQVKRYRSQAHAQAPAISYR